jgi:hypothetical protein
MTTTLHTIDSHELDAVTGGTGIVQGVQDAWNSATNWAFGNKNVNQGAGKQKNNESTHTKTINNYNGCTPPSGG